MKLDWGSNCSNRDGVGGGYREVPRNRKPVERVKEVIEKYY